MTKLIKLFLTLSVSLFSQIGAQTSFIVIEGDTFFLYDEEHLNAWGHPESGSISTFDSSRFVIITPDSLVSDSVILSSDDIVRTPVFRVTDSVVYYEWDSEEINPYKNEAGQLLCDTTICLNDSVTGGYCPPCECGINSEYGYRKWGRYYRFHSGMDLALQYGEPARAAFGGIVRLAKYTPGYGYTVIVRHLNGLETLYGHFSVLNVQSGQYVSAGDTVGFCGSTGHSTGPHLHFEVRYKGIPFDPRKIISFQDYSLTARQITINSSTFHHPTPPKGIKTSAIYHKVKSGETLYKIAGKYRVSVATICKLNRITAKTTLKIGRVLRIR